ncbi:MAG: hypothetical protein DRH12_05685 [Deltaproteobacteria bacterium]|nr:MAG: hypothetical protein DRH12_05685 [Deltaproteobacteria bacterium]
MRHNLCSGKLVINKRPSRDNDFQFQRAGASGFTLVELLLAVVLAGIVTAGIYSLYRSQQKSYAAQEELSQLQAKMRTALYFLERDISMAGCDPTGQANAGIVFAMDNSIRMTMDRDADGDATEYDEDITYSLYNSSGVIKLGRKTPATATNQPVAEYIDALDFVYLGPDGSPLATPVSDPKKIKSVQITIVGRTARADPGYRDTHVYKNQQGDVILGPMNDGYRRMLLSTEVLCRNLALK